MTVFDRPWYGRVLVERVEGFASEAESKPLARVTVPDTVIAAPEGGLRAAGEEPVTEETDR